MGVNAEYMGQNSESESQLIKVSEIFCLKV